GNMDTEDDVYEYDYNDDDDGSIDDNDDSNIDESDIGYEDPEPSQPQPPRGNYAIITNEEDIRVLLSSCFSTIIGVSTTRNLNEKKPNNDQKNMKAKVACGICFDDYYHDEMYDIAAGCGHLFCESCWKGYVNTSVNDGPGCLVLRCPDPACNAAVCQDMVYKLVSDEGCGLAIQFLRDTENYDVTCECTYSFCWNCTEEAHHPVECSTVQKWNIKNTNEGENVIWMLAHSKPCPNCKRRIEKNQGCNSMTCSMCKFQFCWICLNSISNHYACNDSIAKYGHYYERWAGNHSSRAKAVEDWKKVQSVHIEELSSMGSETKTSLEFIADSWKQIIECRRVLKWTYAYGYYYLPEYEKTKKRLFEYLQGEAEHGLERLHECAEKELQPYLEGISPLGNFNDFRKKLIGFTNATKIFFENLVRGLENGLSETFVKGNMDSEDDLYEYIDVDSLDEDDGYIDESDIGCGDSESSDQPQPRRKSYTIMKDEDIRSGQEENIKAVSDVLSVPRSSAIMLLCHHHWCARDIQSEWFDNEGKVRKAVGLFEKKPIDVDQQISKKQKLTCGICFDDYHHDEMYDAGCGHLFCELCWKGYIGTSVNDGPGCLLLRCPDPPCNAAVCQDMVYKFVSDEVKKKYSDYLLRSYIEGSRSIKWCPGPGCGSAIQFVHDTENYDVTCECTYSFCWNCTEEAHHPVECITVEKWNFKNSNEAENVTWILAHSKPCPNCKRPIEKNQGCNHMFCSMCKFSFCWICLVSIKNHRSCNGYQRDDGNTDMGKKIKLARQYIAKYTHYYERWAGNHSSRDKAVEDLKKVQSIIECRRVLKWSYAYGYYLPEHEKTKIQFFEYLQGEAEHGLERLHGCAEKELQPFLDAETPSQVFLNAETPSPEFKEFRMKLKSLTSVTKNYFENLVRGLANGLSEVDCEKERAIEEYKMEGRKYGFYKSDDEA
ncbi:hypothetical protein MKX03_005987, partial [Papaver bracteatum]